MIQPLGLLPPASLLLDPDKLQGAEEVFGTGLDGPLSSMGSQSHARQGPHAMVSCLSLVVTLVAGPTRACTPPHTRIICGWVNTSLQRTRLVVPQRHLSQGSTDVGMEDGYG